MNENVDKYKNLVELLKQALLFYSDENNYKGNQIIADEYGSQARYALAKIVELYEVDRLMENEIINYINDSDNNSDEYKDDILNLIKLYKNK